MLKVFVLDTKKQILNPVHPGEARRLLSSGKAAVFKRYPFTIVLKREVNNPIVEPLRIKLDPGSKTTGIAIVNDQSGEVVFGVELEHRGNTIGKALADRKMIRRSRRQRKTRYRQPRFLNRRNKKKGWIAPSLESRIQNILTWMRKLRLLCNLVAISQELVRFDLQKMENPEISGFEYQQGTLQGYEIREYLLEKWERKCGYCDAENVPLEIEHVVARSKGGSDRISNLCLACEPCNKKKDTKDIQDFLQHDKKRLDKILAQLKKPLKDAAAVNSTRWRLYEELKKAGLPVEVGSGGLTKYNRSLRQLSKEHWIDAVCVGKSTPEILSLRDIQPLHIKAIGHGSRQMCRMNCFGFPRTGPKQAKVVHGFQTGDIVKAIITKGKKTGTYIGKVAIRSTGSFNIATKNGVTEGISYRYCQSLYKIDGYSY